MGKKKATQRLSATRSPQPSSSDSSTSQSVIFDQEGENTNNNSAINNNNNDDGHPAEPPPYSISTSNNNNNLLPGDSSFIPSRSQFLARLNYTKYSVPESTLSKDGTTITTYHPAFTSSPEALVQFVREQAALPPLPYIHIVGGQQESCTRPEFDVKLNMLPYFMSSTTTPQQRSQSQSENNVDKNSYCNGWNYLKLVADDEMAFRGKDRESLYPTVQGGLEEWARRFCSETSTLKSFTLTRHISNWNSQYVEGQIRSLIAATGYKKPVTISFPVKYAKIIVHPPRRDENFLTTLFSSILEKKRYDVVRAIWPYASFPPSAEAVIMGRSCAVQTEDAWWEDWRDVLKFAIVGKRKGWVSLDDMMEYKMCPVTPEMPKSPWGA
ncbi:hypothetical protein V8E54_004597 [Elaphomyces granulatus]